MPEVRLVGPNGEQVGIVPIAKALEIARESDLDLVEVAPTARPPVARLMDYGKFKYESAMKAYPEASTRKAPHDSRTGPPSVSLPGRTGRPGTAAGRARNARSPDR